MSKNSPKFISCGIGSFLVSDEEVSDCYIDEYNMKS